MATTSGIVRRLQHELHDDVEGLVRVVDDDVLLADRREAVAAMVADALGEARDEGLELEVGPLVEDQEARVRIADEAGAFDDGIAVDVEFLGDEFTQRRRRRGIDLHADHRAAAAALQALSNTRTRSSASSSISRSLSRMRRMTPLPVTS